MKNYKYILPLLLFALLPILAIAAPITNTILYWNGTNFASTGTPALSAGFFNATSTSRSNFPYASSTAASATTFCLSTDCRTTWPAGFTNNLLSGGTATTTFYNGGVVFSDSTKLTQSAAAANLFWDETNKRLGIGTAAPSEILHLSKPTGNFTTMRFDSGSTQGYFYSYDGTPEVSLGSNSNATLNFKVNNATEASIGTGQSGLTVQSSTGDHSFINITAPATNQNEATLTTKLDHGSGNTEFVDWTTENYSTDWQHSINVAKSGTGSLRPLSIRFWNSDLGNIAANGTYAQTWLPNGTIGFGVSTTTAGNNGANTLLYGASSTATTLLSLDSAPGTNRVSVARGGFGTTTVSGLTISGSATTTSNVGYSITTGCYAIGVTCITSGGSGTVTSVATNNGLTGGTITTTGTIGLNTAGFSTNALLTWNGSNLVATGTPQLAVGNILSTSTTANSIFTNNWIGVGTTTPQWLVQLASSTASQLTLSDGIAADNHWSWRNAGGNLYLATSSPLTFATSSNSSIAIVQKTGDNTARVGIGTDNPAEILHLSKPTGNFTTMRFDSGATQGYFFAYDGTPEVSLGANSNAPVNMKVNNITRATFDTTGDMGIGTSTSFSTVPGRLVIATTTTAQLTLQGNNGDIPFSFRSIGGQFYIATSSATAQATSTVVDMKIDANGAVYFPSTKLQSAAATDYWCYDTNQQLIRVSAICTTSALRFKKDVQSLDLGLNDLLKLRPVSYYRKDPLDAMDSHRQIGFIADEVASTSPALNEALVTYVGGGTSGEVQGFRYDQFTALITKSVQDLNAKVDKLGGHATRSVEDNWQWIAIGLLAAGFIYQQIQIRNLKK